MLGLRKSNEFQRRKMVYNRRRAGMGVGLRGRRFMFLKGEVVEGVCFVCVRVCGGGR